MSELQIVHVTATWTTCLGSWTKLKLKIFLPAGKVTQTMSKSDIVWVTPPPPASKKIFNMGIVQAGQVV